ncbi:MAG: hypothetical protein K5790_03580 [Nitrosopumilus sp.]|uniref:hypothetical protein n=1 Tax=Nitrosopumilus sp. TaxID=2024843 RepID=UPI00247DDBA5|nr:hypothetical protein [Nitrosopumilus sp.]MCV0392360.1 hypothetical protein [Nitrosopumilus sp.]
MTLQENRILKKTDNVSIRIDSELSNKLHEKCIEQKISLNTLINHILEKQVNWNDLGNEMGWITIFRSTFKDLLDSSSIESIQQIASSTGTNDFKNSLNYFYGNISLETILDLFKKRLQSMNIQFRMIESDGSKKIIIQHDLGKNWPYLVVTQMNTVLNDVGHRIINDQYNKSGFSFEIVSVEENHA